MQNSILLNDAMQVKPAGINVNVNEGMKSLKCAISREAKRLWATKSETMSYLCEETVTYGEVLATVVGFVALMAFVAVSGFIAGGEVM
jgi:hypothetical protein